MKKGKSNKKKSPSRERYDRKRPTFSYRNYEELNERINKVKKAEKVSNTNIVEAGVGLFEVKVAKEKEARDQGYKEGYEKGYAKAKSIYCFTFLCRVCREPIEVTDDNTKKAIEKYMFEHGWGHADCVNRR